MTLTGKLGTSDSFLGNILLGYTGSGGVVQANLVGNSSILASLTHTAEFNALSAHFIVSNGTVVVTFNRELTIDSELLNPSNYAVTGPSGISVSHVYTVDSQTIAVIASGFITGTYTITISPSITDTSSDPLVGNVLIFSAQTPYSVRSLYTYHGPIVKPPLTIQTGHQWSVQTTTSKFSGFVYQTTLNGAILATDTHLIVSSLSGFYGNPVNYSLKIDSEYLTITAASGTEFTVVRGVKATSAVDHVDLAPVELFGAVTLNVVSLPGGAFNSSHIGLYLKLDGSTFNGGSYKILNVLDATHLQVQSSFRAPSSDSNDNSPSNTWTLYDPRTGFIADDPSDVVVRVNGFPVTVSLVIGLLGRIVLGSGKSRQ